MTDLDLEKMAMLVRRQTPEAADAMRKALHLTEHLIDRHLKGEATLSAEQLDNLKAWLLGQFGVTNAGQPKRVFMTSNGEPIRMARAARYQPPPVRYGDPCAPRETIPILTDLGPSKDASGNALVAKPKPKQPSKIITLAQAMGLTDSAHELACSIRR